MVIAMLLRRATKLVLTLTSSIIFSVRVDIIMKVDHLDLCIEVT